MATCTFLPTHHAVVSGSVSVLQTFLLIRWPYAARNFLAEAIGELAGIYGENLDSLEDGVFQC